MTDVIHYRPSKTVSRFIKDDHDISAIMGPVGSGKSVGCCVKGYQTVRAFAALGLPSRGVVVRNTYRELEDTTLATWMEWMRPYGEFKHSTMTHMLHIGEIKAPVMFRALDKPSDIGKLLSLEVSWAWLNEVREIPRAIYDMVQTRIGRYPRREDYRDKGVSPAFPLIMDTNPPDDFHWFYNIMEEVKPDNVGYFRQPGGRSPDAENLEHLREGYYERIAKGKDEAWIKVYVDGEYGFAVDGKPVWPGFKDSRHIASDNLEPEDRPLIVGMDFGLTPAAVFMQQGVTGQYSVLSEVVTEDTAADEFADVVKAHIQERYRGLTVEYYGDPAGSQRSQSDKNTPFRVLKAAGINCKPAQTPGGKPNDFDIRQKAVAQPLAKLDMAGEPALIISPRCKYLRRAMAGGYKYRQLQVSGDERFAAEPDKNIYSHVAEALQYAMIGFGMGADVIGQDVYGQRIDYSRLRRTVI